MKERKENTHNNWYI